MKYKPKLFCVKHHQTYNKMFKISCYKIYTVIKSSEVETKFVTEDKLLKSQKAHTYSSISILWVN